jgi:hypothetical protein
MKQLALMLLFSKRYQRAATFSNPFNFECAKIQLIFNFQIYFATFLKNKRHIMSQLNLYLCFT